MAERWARDVIDDKVTLFIIYVRHYSILFVLLRFVKWFYEHLDEKSFHQNEFKPKIFELSFGVRCYDLTVGGPNGTMEHIIIKR